MTNFETTTECIEAALQLLEEAKQVTTRKSHAEFWDKKVDLLRVVNSAFETGYFTGIAYDELWKAKHLITEAEEEAGRAAEEYRYNS